jgi:uncharacterized membrane protein YbhN (UPF0104 family)
MKDRGKQVAAALLVGAYLFVVFGILLPSVIDYGAVLDAIQAAPAQWLLVVLAAGVVGWMAEGLAMGAFLAGLGLRRGTSLFLSTAAIGSSIPGPVKLAVAYRMLRDWSFSNEASVLGLSLNGLATQASKLILPIVALIGLTLAGSIEGWGLAVAALLSIPVALGAIVSAWVLRSEAFARRVGAYADRAGDAVMRRVKRPEPDPDLSDRLLDFRTEARDVIVARAVPAVLSQAFARSMGFVTLTLSLRAVGIGPEILPNDVVLATYAAVMAITLIPIAPGGAGLPELLYIGIFTAYVADPALDDIIGAGVMLFRVATWFLPIPVGYVVLLVHQRRRGRSRAVETIDEVVPRDEVAAEKPA